VTEQFIDQKQLARRWAMSPRTLERWRWLRQGPVYFKLGGKVVYRLADIESFEREHVRNAPAEVVRPQARAA
jgi:hypothetical protein